MFKIASCHPVKFIVVEDIEDLSLTLSVIRTRKNYVFTECENLN